MRRESRNYLSLLASANRQELAFFNPLAVLNRPGRGSSFPKAPAKTERKTRISKKTCIMSPLNNNQRLDNSTGIGQDNLNEAMQPASQTKKSPWHLRFAPSRLRKSGLAVLAIATLLTQAPIEKAEAFTLLDLMNAIRQSQELASTNSVSTNSPPAPYQPQDGDKIAYVTTTWWGKRPISDFIRRIIGRWTGGAAGSVAGNVIYDASKGAWVNSPSAQAPSGQVWARAWISISGVSGEEAQWHFRSGSPIFRKTINADNYVSETKERDYHYYDVTYWRLKWDADDEIWRPGGSGSSSYRTYRRYGTSTHMTIDRVNSRYNQGKPGAFYPEHEDYKKGKKGYLIVWGTAQKLDLKHEMRSSILPPIDKELKNSASQHGKDKFTPICRVWLEDMRYEKKNGTIGWTYTERTKPVKVTRELSAIVNSSVDVGDEYILLNTKFRYETWKKNFSTISWETVSATVSNGATGTTDDGREFDLSGAPVETRIPKQVVTDFNF